MISTIATALVILAFAGLFIALMGLVATLIIEITDRF